MNPESSRGHEVIDHGVELHSVRRAEALQVHGGKDIS
jgi:hypothetical protein